MKPCYDVPRMLRELADEIEKHEEVGEQVSCVCVTKKFDPQDAETVHDVHGFGQFVNWTECIAILSKGLYELTLQSDEDESDDGTNYGPGYQL